MNLQHQPIHLLVLAIQDKLNGPVNHDALHEMANALMCEFSYKIDYKDGAQKFFGDCSIASPSHWLMLEQLTEICCCLLADHKAAEARLRQFVAHFLRNSLPENQVVAANPQQVE